MIHLIMALDENLPLTLITLFTFRYRWVDRFYGNPSNQGIIRVSRLHPQGTMTVCTKYHGNSSNISVWSKGVDRHAAPTDSPICHPSQLFDAFSVSYCCRMNILGVWRVGRTTQTISRRHLGFWRCRFFNNSGGSVIVPPTSQYK